MPSYTTAKLPMPKSWDEFEDIVADIIVILWDDRFIVRNGRTGQSQNGIDIYGKPDYFKGKYAGVQCKDKKVNIKEIKEEIQKAEGFKPELAEMVFAIGSERDAKLQEEIRIIDSERISKNEFGIKILFWKDICLRLAGNFDLMNKHFSQFIEKSSSQETIIKRVMESNKEDWLFDDEEGVYTYKKDTNLRIVRDTVENDREFNEPWANNFADKRAFVSYHRIFYGSSLIEKIFLVAVDGYSRL